MVRVTGSAPPTIEALSRRYLAWEARQVDRGVITRDVSYARRRRLARLLSTPDPAGSGALGGLAAQGLNAWQVARLRDGALQMGSRNQAVAAVHDLKRVLARAVQDGLLDQNVCERVRMPRHSMSILRPIPTREAVRSVLRQAEPQLALMMRLAAVAGLRSLEIRALEGRHVDHEDGWLEVGRRAEADGTLQTAGRRIRRVVLPPSVAEWVARCRPSAYARLFVDRGGRPLSSQALSTALSCAARAGLPLEQREGFTWVGLRRHAIHAWISAGMGPHAATQYAGCRSVKPVLPPFPPARGGRSSPYAEEEPPAC